MQIPKDPDERHALYRQLTRQCLSTRQDRLALYQTLRNYYLFGSRDERGATYNKIGSTIDTLSSFIYSPASVRFSIQLGTTADREDIFKSIPLMQEVKDQWRISGTHLRFGLGLRWALVYGSMLMKVQWGTSSVRSYLVEPHQFGVLREDVPELADQEAFCLCYTITKSQLHTMLADDPRRNSIMAQVSAGAMGQEGGGRSPESGMQRLVVGGPVDGIPGSVAFGNSGGYVEGGMALPGMQYNYTPQVAVDLVDMVDLYVLDDEIRDYRLISIASPDVVLYARPQSKVGISGRPHFVTIRPENNLYDYFWGESFVARLAPLQDWQTERVRQIRGMMGKQFNPPMVSTGMMGIMDEEFAGFDAPGGRLSSSQPGGKVDVIHPQMPTNAFTELSEIDHMFADTAGIGNILQGKGEAGVRSRGQADLMARLGSARPKNRAIVAEESAAELATLILRNVQEFSPQRFTCKIPNKEDLTFSAQLFTVDYEVHVDAHSSSPIFVEDQKNDALTLLKTHAIDRHTLLEKFDPPNLQMLQERLKVIEQGEAEARKMELAVQEAQQKRTLQAQTPSAKGGI
jgi:hypothetical protein